MNKYIMLCATCFSLVSAPVFAQTSTTTQVNSPDGSSTTTTRTVKKDAGGTATGAVGGAIAGALVAGPVGLVVGGVAGAVAGHTIAPPSEVRTYVTAQSPASVSYSDKIAVGKNLDGEVVWLDVPAQPKYRWAYLNGQRVVVDNETHTVVAIY